MVVRYTAELSGVHELALMLLDVLTGLDELKICTGYTIGGVEQEHLDPALLGKVECVYETMPGWSEDISGVTEFADLPEAARNYVRRIGELVGRTRRHRLRRPGPTTNPRPRNETGRRGLRHPMDPSERIRNACAELGIPEQRFPRSVAIIMDGNGRWARQRGMPRSYGHQQGRSKAVRRIIIEAARLGLDALMLYSFSQQNWSRPPDEIDVLMHLYAEYLIQEREVMMEHNMRLRHLGRRDGLPEMVLKEIDESVRVSAGNTGMWLCLALNYGSREEMLDGVRHLASRARDGEIDPADITEEALSAALDTHDIPDPDLLIRTSGEMRISNFLLWQLSYAEFCVTDTHWPDFDEACLHDAIRAYANRNRRFGAVDDSNT